VLTIFLAGVALLIGQYSPDLLTNGQSMLMIGFLFTLTSLVHLILVKVSTGKPQKFIRVFMITTMVKLALYLAFILILVYLNREQAAGLLVGFLVLYLCYTSLEVVFLRKHLDSQGSG
jgi:L-asparagine transporter-like permease